MLDYPKISELTEKQRIFCERYTTHWNATKAAQQAGYSEETAYKIGSENLRKPQCAEYIQFIKANALEYAGVSQLRNMQELAKVAYGSGADLRTAWENMADWEALPDEVKATIAEVTTTTKTLMGGGDEPAATLETVRVKQYDKLRALEILNRMAGYNAADKVDMTSQGKQLPVTIIRFIGEDDSDSDGNTTTP